jgi:hypothetical protein
MNEGGTWMTKRSIWSMAATVLMLCLSGSGSALAQDPSPAPSALGSPAPLASGGPTTLGAEGGILLEPGRYVDTSLGREITFEVDDGWTSQGAIPGAGVALIKDPEAGPYIAIVPFDGTVFTHPCRTPENADDFGPDLTRLDATPEAFLDHLAAHPFLAVTEPVAVEVGGLSGLQVDVTTSVPDDCDPPWAWLWVLPVVNDYHLTEDVAARVLALDGGDDVVVLVSEVGADSDVASLTETAMSVFESIELGEAG